MKTIKILGTNCTKCKKTFELIKQTAEYLGSAINLRIEKVEPLPQIVAYGIMLTPAVVIDEIVVHKGGVPSTADIEKWIAD